MFDSLDEPPRLGGIKPYEEGDIEDRFTLQVTNVGSFLEQQKILHASLQ